MKYKFIPNNTEVILCRLQEIHPLQILKAIDQRIHKSLFPTSMQGNTTKTRKSWTTRSLIRHDIQKYNKQVGGGGGSQILGF